ncbi:MAG: hypothetical protein HY926_12445 [Elusimicrobia bacterium]|nr:hypothetical protein [Elusimicrobiota bacterium]
MGPPTPPRPSPPFGSRIADYALPAAALGFAAFLALRLAPDDVPVFSDTLREFIAARDCAASAGCSGTGPSSSYLLFHGFIWQRCLSWWMGSGLPLRLVPAFVALLYALSTVPLLRLMERLAGRAAAYVSWAAYLFLVFDGSLADPVWSPGVVGLIVNLFVWCAGAAFLASGRTRAALAAGAAFLLSLASQAHTEALLFIPGMVVFLLLGARPGRRGRAALELLGLALVAAAGWLAFSAGSLRLSVEMVSSFPALKSPRYIFQPEDLRRFAAVAAAFIALAWLSRRRRDRQPCDPFMEWSAGSYLLGLLPVVFGHETPWRYYVPVLPFLCVMGARAAQAFLECWPPVAAALAAALLLVTAAREARPANNNALRLGEAQSLARALSEQGYDCNAAYRYLSGGQRAYVDLLYGMWLFAPCLRDIPTLGEVPPRAERVVLVAVGAGRPVPPAMSPLRPARVAGRGRDFFLFRLPAYVRLDEFSEVVGGKAMPARRFGVANRAFRKRCWDGETLAVRLREMLSPAAEALSFPVRLPAGAAPHTFYLPAVAGVPGFAQRCAGRITAVRGVEAAVSEDGRVMELRGSRKARQGSVTVAWPFDDPRCLMSQFDRYPLPMLELPSGLFAELRDVLE